MKYAKFASVILAISAIPSAMAETMKSVPTDDGSSWMSIGLALIVAAVVVGVVLLLRGRQTPRRRDYDEGPLTYMGGYDTIDPQVRKEPVLKSQAAKPVSSKPAATKGWSVPADFDVPRFLRKTKAYFIRLQESWDKGDVKDIRRFTTRELFGEFCKQFNERGDGPCHTEVVTLGAELEGVDTVGEYYIAKVKFTGMVKEEEAEVMPFTEIWSLSKPLDGHRSWVLTSIQQPV